MKSDEAKTNSQYPSHAFRGFILLLLAVLFWGTAAPLGKLLIVTRFDTLIIVQTRTSLAFVILFVFFILTNRSVFRVQLRDVWKFAVLGIVGVAVTNYTYYYTVKESTVATAILVQYSAPIWIMLYSVFILKEDILDRISIISLVIALAGCFFAVTSGSLENINLKGLTILTGPLSAFTFAYQVIGTKQLIKRYSVWTLLVYMFGFVTIFWLFINPPWNIIAKNYSCGDWGLLWMFAIISILIPQLSFAAGLKYLDASKAGIISVTEPVIAIAAAFLILGESLGIVQMIGGTMVLAAIILLQVHPAIMKKIMRIE
ncbi:MAG: EamA family transporter [Bacteroidetes bacterium]|nr:EamA family transporter [Bacteroidota bacterium]